MNIFESLGLSLSSFLFFMINLAIIVVVVYFLLRKPIRKMIEKEQESLKAIYDENEKLVADSEETKEEYQKLIAGVKEDAMRISNEAVAKAQTRSDEIIEQATAQASNIIETARADVAHEHERVKNDFKESVKEMSFEIAQKILAREINEKDNLKIVDECLKGLEE